MHRSSTYSMIFNKCVCARGSVCVWPYSRARSKYCPPALVIRGGRGIRGRSPTLDWPIRLLLRWGTASRRLWKIRGERERVRWVWFSNYYILLWAAGLEVYPSSSITVPYTDYASYFPPTLVDLHTSTPPLKPNHRPPPSRTWSRRSQARTSQTWGHNHLQYN